MSYNTLGCTWQVLAGFAAGTIGHINKTLCCHFSQNFMLVREVPIGCGCGHSCTMASIRQAEATFALVIHQRARGINESLFQFPMVVGFLHVNSARFFLVFPRIRVLPRLTTFSKAKRIASKSILPC